MVTKFKGTRYQTVFVTESDTTFILDRKAAIYGGAEIVAGETPPGHGIFEDLATSPGIDGNTYRINGKIVGLYSGIETSGDDTKIIVGKQADLTATLGFSTIIDPSSALSGAISVSGENSSVTIAGGAEITGVVGVILNGSGSAATNGGDIKGFMVGMSAGSVFGSGTILDDIRLVNNGHIEALIGLISAGVDGSVLENGKKGEIVGFAIGMGTFSLDDAKTTINNSGTVRVLFDGGDETDLFNTSAAIFGGYGDESVRNTGKLFGDILLGGGDDTFDNRGGFVRGQIAGGAGADTLIVDKASYTLVELASEGLDTVKSSVSYTLADNVEFLILTGGKNISATGNAISNVLLGNKGNNTLTGFGDVDLFTFQTGGGKDTIADFGNGADVINLSKWAAIADYAAVQAHAEDKNGDVWIKVGKDILIIADHAVADLDPSNFSWLV